MKFRRLIVRIEVTYLLLQYLLPVEALYQRNPPHRNKDFRASLAVSRCD